MQFSYITGTRYLSTTNHIEVFTQRNVFDRSIRQGRKFHDELKQLQVHDQALGKFCCVQAIPEQNWLPEDVMPLSPSQVTKHLEKRRNLQLKELPVCFRVCISILVSKGQSQGGIPKLVLFKSSGKD